VEIVRNYVHLSSAHLAEYVDRLSGLQVITGTGDAATLELRSPEMKEGCVSATL
jgi:hypothetical protein